MGAGSGGTPWEPEVAAIRADSRPAYGGSSPSAPMAPDGVDANWITVSGAWAGTSKVLIGALNPDSVGSIPTRPSSSDIKVRKIFF